MKSVLVVVRNRPIMKSSDMEVSNKDWKKDWTILEKSSAKSNSHH